MMRRTNLKRILLWILTTLGMIGLSYPFVAVVPPTTSPPRYNNQSTKRMANPEFWNAAFGVGLYAFFMQSPDFRSGMSEFYDDFVETANKMTPEPLVVNKDDTDGCSDPCYTEPYSPAKPTTGTTPVGKKQLEQLQTINQRLKSVTDDLSLSSSSSTHPQHKQP